MTSGRHTLIGLVAALALLGAAATAQGAEITLAGPRQDAIISTQPGRVIQLPLSWRVDFAGCRTPTSQTVTVTRLSGSTTLVRNPPVLTPPNAAIGRSALLVPAVTVVSRQRWTVTLTCAAGPTVRASRVFVLAPQNAPTALRGLYVLGRQDVWRAGGRCRGTTCLAQVRSALHGRTFNLRSIGGFPYRASVNGAFSCRGRGGRVVRNAGRGQLGLTVTVLTVRAVGTAIVAQRIQVRGFLRLLRNPRARRAGCPAGTQRFTLVGVRR